MTKDEIITLGTVEAHDSSDRAKTVILAGVNEGLAMLRKKLKRHYAIVTRRFKIQANAGVYQAPEDLIRGDGIWVYIGGERRGLTRIISDDEWDNITSSPSSGTPEVYKWISNDLFQVYPTPTEDLVDGGEIRYLSRAKPLSQSDYKAGTIAVTNNGQFIIGTGTTFSPAMVGRYFRLADGADDTEYYRISGFVSSTQLELENYFNGNTQSGLQYLIGEQPNVPQEFHYALISKGLHRYFRSRKNDKLANGYFADFRLQLDDVQSDYAGEEVSTIIPSKLRRPGTGVEYPNRLGRS